MTLKDYHQPVIFQVVLVVELRSNLRINFVQCHKEFPSRFVSDDRFVFAASSLRITSQRQFSWHALVGAIQSRLRSKAGSKTNESHTGLMGVGRFYGATGNRH